MKPKWQKLASLAQEICTLLFQFFGAVFASKGHPFKNIFEHGNSFITLGPVLPLIHQDYHLKLTWQIQAY